MEQRPLWPPQEPGEPRFPMATFHASTEEEVLLYAMAGEMLANLEEFGNWLRGRVKYDEEPPSAADIYDRFRCFFGRYL